MNIATENFSFDLRIPNTIFSGPGSIARIAEMMPLKHAKDVLLVTDTTLCELGYAEKVQQALNKNGIQVKVFDRVEPEPSAAAVNSLVQQLAGERVDAVIGLGGGSPMDVAKIAALLLATPQELNQIFGVNLASGKRLPLILVPTTAGTGSEVTGVAVVMSDNGDKAPVLSPQMLGDAVILDPELTLNCPAKTTAATGVDAMVHAIEAFTSGARKNPVSDKLALHAMDLLFNNIRSVVKNGNDIAARGAMLNGSMLAGLAFANATVGAVHALAYPIGGLFHVSHGGSNAVVLPAVMRFNLPTARTLYATIARSVLPDTASSDDLAAANQLINALERLIPDVGLEDRLAQFGIAADDVSALCDGALRQERLLSYNIRPIDGDDITEIYQRVL
jgi:alcohol dehydrogenase class IV